MLIDIFERRKVIKTSYKAKIHFGKKHMAILLKNTSKIKGRTLTFFSSRRWVTLSLEMVSSFLRSSQDCSRAFTLSLLISRFENRYSKKIKIISEDRGRMMYLGGRGQNHKLFK